MVIAQSATSAGKGGGEGAGRVPGRPAGSGAVRQRRSTGGATTRSKTVAGGGTGGGGGSAGMWRFYQEDSPGLKVGPVPVLVMSLIFIASVFVLHIWGKYTRG